jgi:hypothetical protein
MNGMQTGSRELEIVDGKCVGIHPLYNCISGYQPASFQTMVDETNLLYVCLKPLVEYALTTPYRSAPADDVTSAMQKILEDDDDHLGVRRMQFLPGSIEYVIPKVQMTNLFTYLNPESELSRFYTEGVQYEPDTATAVSTLASISHGKGNGGVFTMDTPPGYKPGKIKYKREPTGMVYVLLRSVVGFAVSNISGPRPTEGELTIMENALKDIDELGVKKIKFGSNKSGKN